MAFEVSDLCLELNRIGTYLGWPGQDTHTKNGKPMVVDLAKAGFYYTHERDEVRCFCCGLQIGDWERHHEPFVVHATRNPQCPFVMDHDSGNKPVYVPPEREYAAIMAMLRETGKRVASTATGSSYSSSSLVSDLLKALYGESMMSSAPRQVVSQRSTVSRSASSSPRMNHAPATDAIRSTTPSRGDRMARAAANTPPPPRRSSTSDSTSSSSPAPRPLIQRARSYAADPRIARQSDTSGNRQSETIANRQSSNPGIDHREYQESQDARLQTFTQWPGIRGAMPGEFAQAGFIFIGPPDRVQCVFCGGILRNWNDNDVPLEEHRKHFPNCSFVKDSLANVTVDRPRHSRFRTEPSRLNSFQGWNMNKNPKPAELSKAGFFYVGHGDSVKCFFCDGGLRNWEPNDDPWREHARWFPNCGYVKQSKGQPFIDAVLNDTNLTEYQTASVDETEVKNVAHPPVREVDPREVTARMDSGIVRTVLGLDVPRDLVKKAIKKRLSENGEDFASAEALLEAVFSLDAGAESAEGDDTEGATVQDVKFELEPTSSTSSMGSNQADSLQLAEENRRLKEQRQCKICMDEEVCVAFLPCGHLVCCATCAAALNACPICRGKIRGTVRTYLS